MGQDTLSPALMTDKERWQIFTENVKDYAIFMLSPEGKVATWNAGAQRILGYEEDEILGHDFWEIFVPADVRKHRPEQEMQTAREQGRAEDERWHLRKDGTRFWASGLVMPLWDKDGQLRGYAKVLRDVTERKTAEDTLTEENRRKDEFLATLSHELRSPLAAIQNAVQLLRMDPATSGIETTDIIERQMSGLVRMVDDLTDVSRINSGKIHLRVERVCLQHILENCIETVNPQITDGRHALVVNLPLEPIWLGADPDRLRQVFCNLLNNSAKYTPSGGKIWLSAELEERTAVVTVKDNGAGIAPDALPKIFDLFIQGDRSLDRTSSGLGIGLTLVKRLLEMHGGEVEARSEGLGHGSEFTVRLPVMTGKPAAESSQAKTNLRMPGQLRLLIAEDSVDTAKTLTLLLRKLGHEVEAVYDGPSAVQRAIQMRPTAVLLDIGLPGMNGYKVAERLRAHADLDGIFLVAMTGYGQEEDRERSRQAGFDRHLVKPISFANIEELLFELGQRD